MASVQRSSLLAALQRTQSSDKNANGPTKPKKSPNHDTALPPLRGIGTGNDSSVHHHEHDLAIGEMNSATNPKADPKPVHQRRQQRFESGKLYPLLPGKLSFTAHESDEHTIHEIKKNPLLFFFSTDLQERYLPFCSDFGPVNLGTLVQFCDYLRDKESDQRLVGRHMIYYCTNDVESVSNTTFLLSAYLMLEHHMSPEDAVAPFSSIIGLPVVPFRDPTFVKSTFDLTVLDCLHGLKKAVELRWFDMNEFDLEQYEDLDHPDNGDVHQICPKFLAFRGPETRHPHAPDTGASPPELLVGLFLSLCVSKVIRLNEPGTYDRKQFEAAGMQHVDLFFEDCSTPSDELVAQFMHEAEDPGLTAVHCLAGLGRTGTMIGLWLMAKHAFSAREAIAWMRIVRPGMVIGPQQHYLEWMQRRLLDGSFPSSLARPPSSSQRFGAPSAALSEELAGQIRKAISKR